MIVWLLPLLGAALSAWHGGQIVGGSPKILKNMLWTAPFTIAAAAYTPWYMIPFTLLCLLKALGHGRGFRLNEPMEEGSEPEKVEYLIGWLYGKIPLYWYKVLIMALTGFGAVSGAVIAFAVVNPLAGLALAIGGLFKGANAMIFDKNSRGREWADGFTAYLGLSAALVL